MSVIRTIEIDAATDARLSEIAARRGQDVAAVIADAIDLLERAAVEGPDVDEDRRRLDAFGRTKSAVSFDEVKAWAASWGTGDELPRPQPRKIG